ncbi:RPC10 subunit of RNA polymerases and III, putative [Babesia ovata]|uniref:RPC10 subunit of RNA polymerases and III, putative n=1 Tax=Babesia ovata TaxID=189622 RepID=A0A2H6K8D5_9APIC|nr:RPC10 subunit of RNA polymerases and III, putative [Babesia ovata]GBE59256.1 RPC10 subunit of RNA polymerases and III, putative [Babesia ovata]
MEASNSIETQEHLEPIIYICAGLKQQVEKFLTCDDDGLLGLYDEYVQFKALLTQLLSTVARYRIQLSSTDATKVFWGPKTRLIIETLVRHYDKVYEIDEEQLAPRFAEVERVNELLSKQATEDADEDEGEEISILEETKEDLKRIQQVKEQLKNKPGFLQANLSDIPNQDAAVANAFYCVQQVYKNDPAVSLEDILAKLYKDDSDNFLLVLGNVSNLISQIAKHPDELQLRLLRVNNEQLYEDIIRHPGAVALLKYTRFKIKHGEELKDALTQLGFTDMSDEYFLYLNEPDMFGDYGAWKEWIDFVGSTSRLLENFTAAYKSLLRTKRSEAVDTVAEAMSQSRVAIGEVP